MSQKRKFEESCEFELSLNRKIEKKKATLTEKPTLMEKLAHMIAARNDSVTNEGGRTRIEIEATKNISNEVEVKESDAMIIGKKEFPEPVRVVRKIKPPFKLTISGQQVEELSPTILHEIQEYQQKMPLISDEVERSKFIEDFTRKMQEKTDDVFYKFENEDVIEDKCFAINFWTKENHIFDRKGRRINGKIRDGKRLLTFRAINKKNGIIFLPSLINTMVNGKGEKKTFTFTDENKDFLLNNAYANHGPRGKRRKRLKVTDASNDNAMSFEYVDVSSSSLAKTLINESSKNSEFKQRILATKICKEGKMLFNGSLKKTYVSRGIEFVKYNNVAVPVHKLMGVVFFEEEIKAYEKRIKKIFNLFGPTEINILHKDFNKLNNHVSNLKPASLRLQIRTKKRAACNDNYVVK